MVDEKIPELTLAPDLDAAPVAPQAPAVEQQAPSAGPEMEKLTEKEQQAVLAFAEKIDLSNSNQILQYGSSGAEEYRGFFRVSLNSVRTKDMGEIGGMADRPGGRTQDLWTPAKRKRKACLAFSARRAIPLTR